MTKSGSFDFFGLPPEGSGVAPKSRMERYFFSESAMTEVHRFTGSEVQRCRVSSLNL